MYNYIFALFIFMFSIAAIGQMGNIRTQKIDVIVPNSMPELTIDSDLDVYGISEFQDNLNMTGDGALKLPVGTDAQRPTPLQGMIRYNTDQSSFEGYNGATWAAIGGGTSVFSEPYLTVNDGGTQSDADAGPAGLLVTMTDATDAALSYDSGAVSRFLIGELGDQYEVVTTGHAQTLVSKIFDLSEMTYPTRLDVKQGTQAALETYATTATSGQLAFATDTKAYYGITDNALVDLGGNPSSQFNNILNPTPKIDTSGWVRYKTTSPSATPDDFAGVPNGAVTWTRNTTNALNNVSDFLLTKDANNRQGEGVYYQFDIRNGDKTLKQLLKALKLDSANVTDSDISLFLVTSSDGFVTRNIIRSNLDGLLAGTRDFFKQFQLNSTDTEARLCIHIASTNALAYTIQFNDFFLGLSPVATSALRIDDKEYVPATTQGLGTIASTDLFYDVDGQYINISGRLVIGTPTAVEARIALPDGKVSSSAIPTLEIAGVYGQGNVGAISGYISIEPSKNYFVFTAQNAGNGALTKQNGSAIFGAGVAVSIKARIKIEGQSSNAVSSIDLGARYIGQEVRANTTPALAINDPIPFNGVNLNGSGLWTSSTNFSVPENGDYDISVEVFATATITSWNVIVYNVTDSISLPNGTIAYAPSSNYITSSRVVPLLRGKVYQLRTSDAYTLNALTVFNTAKINKVASPQTILGAEPMNAFATTTAGAAIANNTLTTIVYNSVTSDTHAAINTSTGDITIKSNGVFDFSATASLAGATAGTGIMFMEIYKNGTRVVRSGFTSITDTNPSASISAKSIPCNVNDVITIRMLHTNGVSRNMGTTVGFNTFGYSRQ